MGSIKLNIQFKQRFISFLLILGFPSVGYAETYEQVSRSLVRFDEQSVQADAVVHYLESLDAPGLDLRLPLQLTDEIHPEFKKRLLGVIQQIPLIFGQNVLFQDVFHLIYSIEQRRNAWIEGNSTSSYRLRYPSGGEVQMGVKAVYPHLRTPSSSSSIQLYLKKENSVLDYESSGRKRFYEMTAYPNGFQVVDVELNSKRSKYFPGEGRIYQRIVAALNRSGYSSGDQAGIAEVFYSIPHSLIQKKYDQDLKTYLSSEEGLALPLAHRLSLMAQIANGLRFLHELGIVHGDIKEENILVERLDSVPSQSAPVRIVLADFDLAFLPENLIDLHENRPISGTLRTLAPELQRIRNHSRSPGGSDASKWIGSSSEEQLSNALKSDVFALGTVAFKLLKKAYPSWYIRCDEGVLAASGYERFLQCKEDEIEKYLHSQSRRLYLYFIDHLLSVSVDQDPSQRISSSQFYDGLQYLQRRSNSGNQNSSPELTLGDALARYAYLGVRSLSGGTSPEGLLSGNTVGSYFLTLDKIAGKVAGGFVPSDRLFFHLYYLDRAGVVQNKILMDLDSRDPSSLSEGLDFLKKLGTIR